MAVTIGGRRFLEDLGGHDGLVAKIHQGWTFQTTKLTEEYGPEAFLEDRVPEARLIMAKRGESRLIWLEGRKEPALQAGDVVLSFGPAAPNGLELDSAPV